MKRRISTYLQLRKRSLILLAIILSVLSALDAGEHAAFAYFWGTSIPWVAPQGWHTSYPGYQMLSQAISTNDPGLMLACGFSHCSRSWDGGAHWTDLTTPAIGDLTAPINGGKIFFLAEFDPHQSQKLRFWATYDAGSSWHLLATGSLFAIYDLLQNVGQSIYREGRFYALENNPPNSFRGNPLFASSRDGVTWTFPKTTPSAAERQGWQPQELAADYRAPLAWYRLLHDPTNKHPFLLEHSSDDGHSWTAIGPIGSATEGMPSMATAPYQPTRLCIAISPFNTDYSENAPLLFSGTHGGTTWHNAAAPTDPSGTTGTTIDTVQLGQNGGCYIEHDYSVAAIVNGMGHSTFVASPRTTMIWRLPPDSDQVEVLLHTTVFYPNSNPVNRGDFAYVPGKPRFAAHLFLYSFYEGDFSTALIAVMIGTWSDDQILWTNTP